MKITPITQAGNIYNYTSNNQKENKKEKQKDKEKSEKFSATTQKNESKTSK